MTDTTEAAVASAIPTVLRDTGCGVTSVEEQMLLSADLGFDSLDLAQTVVLLEQALGQDPLSHRRRRANRANRGRPGGDLPPGRRTVKPGAFLEVRQPATIHAPARPNFGAFLAR
jgi:acyl carrier protein